LHFTPYTFTPIAATDGRFLDFAPYVASLTDEGVVAFQATLAEGHSGVFTGDGGAITDIATSLSADAPAQAFASHPDINRAGTVTVYATLQGGEQAVLRIHADGRVDTLGAGQGFTGIGPLGPTMNARGDVAFRATSRDGRACIGVWRDDRCEVIAEAGDLHRGFEGLPVVDPTGRVAFRADLADGAQAVFLCRDDRSPAAAIATTGPDFAELARFPTMNDRGGVAFAARRASGGWGLFAAAPGGTACLVDAQAGFESFRGLLINDAGLVAFYATPVGGQLGIYTGPDPRQHRLLGLGDPLFGATVVDFALNPVSVNARGQLALRVALDDGRQFILRADPAA
jgi:hypothetical protein